MVLPAIRLSIAKYGLKTLNTVVTRFSLKPQSPKLHFTAGKVVGRAVVDYAGILSEMVQPTR